MQEMKILSAQEFRQKLAGVVDPRKQKENEQTAEEIKQEAISFCSILPELFSSDLDRMTMWERIGNGIIAACKKCGGDTEEFVHLVLEFIKANPAMLASNKRLERWLIDFSARDEEDKRMFLRTIEKKSNVILVYARNLWGEIKDAKRPLKEGE